MVLATIGCQDSKAEQEPAKEPITRTMLLKPDVTGTEGKEALVILVEFAPGAVGGKHFHPGHEIVYMLEGSLILEVEGKEPATYKAGDTFDIPREVVHGGKNPSTTAGVKALVFALFEKGQPATTPVE
jgi:quercetin dioxygenase-like cupin family protein